eukprot:m.98567 g.98567  ORF g.98567 m.98567 type:complete len:747 (-) comp15085_c0_seq1:110-2350(-)
MSTIMSQLPEIHVDRAIDRLKHCFSHVQSSHAWLFSNGPNRRDYNGSDTPAAIASWLLGDSTPLSNALFVVFPTSHQLHIISSNTKLKYLQPLKLKAPFSVKLHNRKDVSTAAVVLSEQLASLTLYHVLPVEDDPLLQAMADALSECHVKVEVYKHVDGDSIFWPLRYKDSAAYAALKQGGSILSKHMATQVDELKELRTLGYTRSLHVAQTNIERSLTAALGSKGHLGCPSVVECSGRHHIKPGDKSILANPCIDEVGEEQLQFNTVVISSAAEYKGLHVMLARTLCFAPTPEQMHAYAILHQLAQRAATLLKPGTKIADVCARIAHLLTETHPNLAPHLNKRFGHSTGYLFHDKPRLNAKSSGTVEAGDAYIVTLSLANLPYPPDTLIGHDGQPATYSLVWSDTVYVTKSGLNKVVTRSSYESPSLYRLPKEDLTKYAPALPAEILKRAFARLDVISLARCSQVCRSWRNAAWTQANFGAACSRLRTHRPLFTNGNDVTSLGVGQRPQFRGVQGSVAPESQSKAPIYILGSLTQPRHQTLEKLSFQGCLLHREEMSTLSRFDRLQYLNLNSVRTNATRALVAGVNQLLQRSDQLKHLAMKSAALNSDCIHILSVAVVKNRSLKLLDLRNNPMGDAGAKHLAQCLLAYEGNTLCSMLLGSFTAPGGLSPCSISRTGQAQLTSALTARADRLPSSLFDLPSRRLYGEGDRLSRALIRAPRAGNGNQERRRAAAGVRAAIDAVQNRQ